MSKYDKSAEYKIDKIIKESAQSNSQQPKATVIAQHEGNHSAVNEMQGE